MIEITALVVVGFIGYCIGHNAGYRRGVRNCAAAFEVGMLWKEAQERGEV